MSVTRLRYRERQRLIAADFLAEQAHRLGLAGRHHLTLHDWGIVRGLHVSGDWNHGFTLTPGLAIDGYGREIWVTRAQPIQHPAVGKTHFLLLHYCEHPASRHPDASCQENPAPRVRHSFQLELSSSFTAPLDTEFAIESARAADPQPSLPPFPVLVAILKNGKNEPDLSLTRYVRHRAGTIRSPRGTAQLRLGRHGHNDIYDLMLSARSAGGLEPRIAIDRDGTTHIWRDLMISGDKATGTIALAQHQLLQVSGTIDPENKVRAAELIELGSPQSAPKQFRGESKAFSARSPKVKLGLDGAGELEFELLEGPRHKVREAARGKRKARVKQLPEAKPLAFSEILTASGGALELRRLARIEPAREADCGDVVRERVEGAVAGTPVVQFKPAAAAEDDGLSRRIYAVTTSKPSDPVPKTELRISGGAEDDSDRSRRVCVGARDGGDFLPVLGMDGARGVEILAPPGGDQNSELLDVKGAVHLPAIGKKDPLLAELMGVAMIAGLRQMGATIAGVTAKLQAKVPASGDPIRRGEELSYELELNFNGTLALKQCIELAIGVQGTRDMAFRSIASAIEPTTGKKFEVRCERFLHPADKVRIEVQLMVSFGGKTGVVIPNALEFVVEDPA